MPHRNEGSATPGDHTDGRTGEGSVSRRRFIQTAGASVAGVAFGSQLLYAARTPKKKKPKNAKNKSQPTKLIYIAIDALHPAYLELNANGDGPGSPGDWLMPKVRDFLTGATWFPNAKDYLPAATDMNHVNAIAGTSSGQTGIISVSTQLMGWDSAGEPIPSQITMDWARDDLGRPVDTLFHAWKRKSPSATTAFISGKGWVAEMFRNQGVVDLIVTGSSRPSYVPEPESHDYCDPPTDDDAYCDAESAFQKFNVISLAMRAKPRQFPPDSWVVDAALAVYQQASPDMSYILLAQVDDTGHAIGATWDAAARAEPDCPPLPKLFCDNDPADQLVTTANPRLYVEPILDAIRDTDIQFGRLIEGLSAQGVLDDATVMLVSDHAMVTLLRGPDMERQCELQAATDYYQLIIDAGLGTKETVTPFSACGFAMVYWRAGKEQVPLAKQLLEAHTAVNPETGQAECPWFIVDRAEMKYGKDGVCLPGELYHQWFIETDAEQTMVWPDLFVFAKNGWEIPVYGAGLGNLGISVPDGVFIGPLYLFPGGHGSLDTQPIVMAIRRPGMTGSTSSREVRIADLAVTAADLYGLQLQSTTVGENLSGELS